MINNTSFETCDIEPNTFLDMPELKESKQIIVKLLDKDNKLELPYIMKDDSFLIVYGGWIPCSFIRRNTLLLADRNVISEIITRYRNGKKEVSGDFDAFDNIFLNSNIKLDITSYLIEGNKGRVPTNSEIDEELEIVIKALKIALPKLDIAVYPNQNAYYYNLKDANSKSIEERMRFLQEISSKINKEFTHKTREKAVMLVYETAKNMELKRDDFVIILVLLRIIMKGKKSAAKLILKDSQIYTEEKAYNAAFDLTNIVMLLNLHIYHLSKTNFKVAFITKDKGLALFSSLLNNLRINKRENGNINFMTTLTTEIFDGDIEMIETYRKWLNGEI
ncbi:hypothetical protein ACN5O4_00275 [Aliarcobacter butzleri]|uniref:hypothetical protein n=1 Tax=Aliarcobacter butzleri TaxID=28197 RepID=UPI003AF5FF93